MTLKLSDKAGLKFQALLRLISIEGFNDQPIDETKAVLMLKAPMEQQAFVATLKQQGIEEPALLAHFWREATVKAASAGQVLVAAGERPESFYVLLKGLLRYYYQSHDGKEWNKAFFTEGQLVGSFSAYLRNAPCPYNIEALEPSLVAVLPLSLVDQYRDTHQEYGALFRRLIEQTMLRNEAREAVLLTCNNEARYQWLCAHEGHLLGRVAQYHLASYLSMDAVSFSRVKKKCTQD